MNDNTTNTPRRHSATFGDFARLTNQPADICRKMMATIAAKTQAEQLEIFKIKTEIAYNIKTSNRNQIDQLKMCRTTRPEAYDYCMLLLALQIQEAKESKSQYVTHIRELRQDPQSFRTSPKAKAISCLIPLIDELRKKGATWDYVASYINNHKRKILSNRKVSVDYLKKTYHRIKKEESHN